MGVVTRAVRDYSSGMVCLEDAWDVAVYVPMSSRWRDSFVISRSLCCLWLWWSVYLFDRGLQL
jgi:hypothetical protein